MPLWSRPPDALDSTRRDRLPDASGRDLVVAQPILHREGVPEIPFRFEQDQRTAGRVEDQRLAVAAARAGETAALLSKTVLTI